MLMNAGCQRSHQRSPWLIRFRSVIRLDLIYLVLELYLRLYVLGKKTEACYRHGGAIPFLTLGYDMQLVHKA